jgi:hypothetical protein
MPTTSTSPFASAEARVGTVLLEAREVVMLDGGTWVNQSDQSKTAGLRRSWWMTRWDDWWNMARMTVSPDPRH